MTQVCSAICFAMPGTEVSYGVPLYAMRCLVLSCHMLLLSLLCDVPELRTGLRVADSGTSYDAQF
eukprot:2853675-Rhodomonas_salina.3